MVQQGQKGLPDNKAGQQHPWGWMLYVPVFISRGTPTVASLGTCSGALAPLLKHDQHYSPTLRSLPAPSVRKHPTL